ncbi:MAG: hypothetical protein J2P29_09805 [Actinobacteria bacterium]|nr:hypothetical protein [Actinomycetota bacterium]
MVSRKMKSGAALSLIRRRAREHELKVRELPGRGKGSHRMFVIETSSGAKVGNFGLTGHPKELSWTVLKRLEERLAPLFGERWMG